MVFIMKDTADNRRLLAFILQVKLDEGCELTKEELLFIAQHPQREYYTPFLCQRKRKGD